MSLIVAHACLEVMDRPWHWGEADCCTAACDVFARLFGVDPMAPLRGGYSTRRGAARLIAAHGGFDVMAQELAAQAGLVRGDGKAGEIGVIRTFGQLALGIRIGNAWAGKTQTGMATVPEAVRSWRAA